MSSLVRLPATRVPHVYTRAQTFNIRTCVYVRMYMYIKKRPLITHVDSLEFTLNVPTVCQSDRFIYDSLRSSLAKTRA